MASRGTRPVVLTFLAALVLAITQLPLGGCASRAVSTTTGSDVAAYRAQLQIPDWLAQMNEREIAELVAEALETPVDFYGRVVDPEGRPVAGVEVSPALFDHRLEPFEFPYIGWTVLEPVETDADGRFELTGVAGSALYVRVAKAGWKSVGNSKRHLRYAQPIRYLNEHPLPSAAQPMQFVMAPGLPLEDYYVVQSGAVLLPRDGSEIGYRLDAVNPYGVDPDAGDVAVACRKGPVTPAGRWDWSCKLRMPNGGGVQLRRELVLQQAPADGYGDAYAFGMRADDPDWDHRAERYLYVRLRDGRYYGQLAFKVRTAGDFFFALDGMVNKTGGRQLESLYAANE
jgi:hypothetical protein